MAITKPTVLPSWAEAGDKVQPSNAEIQVGWPLSSIPPSRQRFNWLLNFLANGIRYFSRRGLPDYDAAETYMTGDRIIGDDGKTYRSLIDNNIGQTPSAQPTKWERWGFTFSEFAASVTTPPQFDNDTSLATTAFVQRAIGGFGQSFGYGTAGQTIAPNRVNSTINLFGTCSSIVLPLASACPVGSVIFFSGFSLDCAITRQGTDVIWANGTNTSLTSLTVKDGGSLMLVNKGAGQWFASGTPVLKYANEFQASLAANGYQKLPSGLILQWGAAATNASGTAVVSFPVAFPSAVLSAGVVATNGGGVGTLAAAVQSTSLGVSGMSLWYQTETSGVTLYWYAIGK